MDENDNSTFSYSSSGAIVAGVGAGGNVNNTNKSNSNNRSQSITATSGTSGSGGGGGGGGGSERMSSISRKGMVLGAPQRQWLGFGVLWQFIQDPTITNNAIGDSGIDENLIDLATQLLVDLLEDEFKDERELILQRCLDNIQMGMSVPVSLRLLRKTLGTYPMPSRSWFKVRKCIYLCVCLHPYTYTYLHTYVHAHVHIYTCTVS